MQASHCDRNSLIKGQVQIQGAIYRQSKTKLLVTCSGSKNSQSLECYKSCTCSMWCPECYAGRMHGLWLLSTDQLLLPAGTKTVLNGGQAVRIQPEQVRVPRKLLRRHESATPAQARPLPLPAPAPTPGTHQREGQPPPAGAAGARRQFLSAAAAGGHGSPRTGSHPTPRGEGKAAFYKD